MTQGGTPFITIKIKGAELKQLDNYEIYLRDSNDMLITIRKDRITLDEEEHNLYFILTQEETLSLGVGYVKVQARLMYEDGNVVPTRIAVRKVEELISKEVMK